MHIFIIIVVIILILFIPIPLSFHLYISKDKFYIKFYNLNLLSNEDGIIRKLINKKYSNKAKKTIDNNDIDSSNKKISLKKLYHNLIHNKFKPTLKFNNIIIYSFGDAANTAIAFGLLYNFNPLLLNIFSIIFKVKKYNNDFKPVFKNKIIFELTLNSIISFNLAKIIYIYFIILKSFKEK